MNSRYALGSIFLVGLFAGPTLVACNADPAAVSQGPGVGSVEMQLRLSEAVELSSVEYTLSGNGFYQAGTVPVDHSRSLRFQVGGIPEGAGYTVTLHGTGDAEVECDGSADFDIAARQTTLATVRLECRLPSQAGSVVVSGEFNLCPVLTSLSLLPSEVEVGGTVTLTAVAQDDDEAPSPLTYDWAVDGGELALSAPARAEWLCLEPGDFTVSLSATDGACADEVQGEIVCLEPEATGAVPTLVWSEVESSGGDPGDWAELYNAGDVPVELGGYTFQDNDDSHVYVVAEGTRVLPGAYLVLEGYDFGLGSNDSVRLFDLEGRLVAEYTWAGHAQTTYGRCPDASGEFALTTAPTKGAANDCTPAVYFNEVESSGGEPGDWVELFNAGLNVADLSGFRFSDDDDGHSYVLPAATLLAPGEYLVLETATFGFGLGGADAVRLFDRSGELVDSYSWSAHSDTTYGRCPNGGGAFETTAGPTKGTENACAISVRLNEVVSTGGVPGDWVELVNTGAAVTDISGWSFLDDNDTHVYVFPAGTELEAGAFLVLDAEVFGFGLGNGDAARLFDAQGVMVDSYTYAEHAATSWGRCPDGSGEFMLTASVTRGSANACPTDPTVTQPWPGGDAVQTVDPSNAFPENLSGLHYQPQSSVGPAVLWGALNGPSKIYQLLWNGVEWAPAPGEWVAGKSLTYPDGTGAPDTEGVTKAAWDEAGIYAATERNNDQSSVSRLSVLRFDETAAGAKLTATHEWDLTSLLPTVGANKGLEGITWVSDDALVGAGFVDATTSAAYNPASYPGHGSGLFVVGVEGTGSLHVLALDHASGSASIIATVASGHPAVMGLEYDRDSGQLFAACDNTCNNELTVLAVDASGAFAQVARYGAPGGLPNSNNEGLAFASDDECSGGQKPVFWSDDSNFDGHALRRGTLACGAP